MRVTHGMLMRSTLADINESASTEREIIWFVTRVAIRVPRSRCG